MNFIIVQTLCVMNSFMFYTSSSETTQGNTMKTAKAIQSLPGTNTGSLCKNFILFVNSSSASQEKSVYFWLESGSGKDTELFCI